MYYQRALHLIHRNAYTSAVTMLQEAADWLPMDSSIQHRLGKLHVTLTGFVYNNPLLQETLLSIAIEYLKEAARLNPLEPEIALSLAHALELRGEKAPDEILAAYEHLLTLAPNTVQYLMMYTDKLYAFDRQEKLPEAVQRLGRIYPGRYGTLRRKAYWNSEMEEIFAQGLLQAIEDNTDPRKARRALAGIKARQQDWAGAAQEYRLALQLKPSTNTPRHFFQLARYYLHADSIKPAYEAISAGLRQSSGPINLQHLFSLFQRTGHENLFPEFYLFISSELSFSYSEDIAMAELLIKKKHYGFALKLVNRVLAERDYLEKPLRLREKILRLQEDAGS